MTQKERTKDKGWRLEAENRRNKDKGKRRKVGGSLKPQTSNLKPGARLEAKDQKTKEKGKRIKDKGETLKVRERRDLKKRDVFANIFSDDNFIHLRLFNDCEVRRSHD